MDDGRWTMDDGRWTMDDGRLEMSGPARQHAAEKAACPSVAAKRIFMYQV